MNRAASIRVGRTALGELELSLTTRADKLRHSRITRLCQILDIEQAEAYSIIEEAAEKILAGDVTGALALLQKSADEHRAAVVKATDDG